MKLLKELCNIHAPAGEEFTLTEFLLKYVTENQTQWKVKPTLHYGKRFQDNLIMVFGKPRTAVFAHLDSIGFTVRYNNEIVKIGGPVSDEGIVLVGEDSKGKIEGKIIKNKELSIIYHLFRLQRLNLVLILPMFVLLNFLLQKNIMYKLALYELFPKTINYTKIFRVES